MPKATQQAYPRGISSQARAHASASTGCDHYRSCDQSGVRGQIKVKRNQCSLPHLAVSTGMAALLLSTASRGSAGRRRKRRLPDGVDRRGRFHPRRVGAFSPDRSFILVCGLNHSTAPTFERITNEGGEAAARRQHCERLRTSERSGKLPLFCRSFGGILAHAKWELSPSRRLASVGISIIELGVKGRERQDAEDATCWREISTRHKKESNLGYRCVVISKRFVRQCAAGPRPRAYFLEHLYRTRQRIPRQSLLHTAVTLLLRYCS